MTARRDAYTGTDNLEAMQSARRYNAFLTDLALRSLPADGRYLDFGAGIGTFARAVARTGRDVTALDTEPDHVAVMRAEGLHAISSLDGVPDHAFDGAWSFNVLEHIGDDIGALRTVRRVIRPGGILVAYLPALPLLWTSMDDKVRHHRRYTRASLSATLAAAGFATQTCRYADSLGALVTLVYKAIGSREGDITPRSVALYDRFVFPMSHRLDALTHRLGGKNVFAIAVRTP